MLSLITMQTKIWQKIPKLDGVWTPGTLAFWMYGEIQSAFLALDSFSDICEGQTDREWFRFDQDICLTLFTLTDFREWSARSEGDSKW